MEMTENQMPGYTTHTMGVGAVVINAQRQVLSIQEASGPASKMGASGRPAPLLPACLGVIASSIESRTPLFRLRLPVVPRAPCHLMRALPQADP